MLRQPRRMRGAISLQPSPPVNLQTTDTVQPVHVPGVPGCRFVRRGSESWDLVGHGVIARGEVRERPRAGPRLRARRGSCVLSAKVRADRPRCLAETRGHSGGVAHSRSRTSTTLEARWIQPAIQPVLPYIRANVIVNHHHWRIFRILSSVRDSSQRQSARTGSENLAPE